jgi:hypothetical protein
MSDKTNNICDLKAWFRGDARDSGSYRMGALLVEELERVEAERDRLRAALEQAVRGLDAIRRIGKEGRGASGKLDDIMEAALYERYAATAALVEGGSDAAIR